MKRIQSWLLICVLPLFVQCDVSIENVHVPLLRPRAEVNEWRLPRDLQPVSYNLRLLPFIEEGNFTTDGFIEMTVDCLQSTDTIVFHSVDTTIDYTSIQVTWLSSFINCAPLLS
jgi:hypothetical protein